MKLIKLDAIDSTNDFLKAMSGKHLYENFTVVSAENQTNGKGQMGAKWNSETGKNLIFSVLVNKVLNNITEIFDLNVAVALSLINTLEKYNIPDLSIKWPNDILSDNKKIAGILIENTIKNNVEITSIIGIGLNVNQLNFDELPMASSMAVIKKIQFDKEILLNQFIECLKLNCNLLQNNYSKELWNNYNMKLFKKGILMAFSLPNGNKFMGIIQGVNSSGKLEIKLENDVLETYGIKEIQLLY
ncbi:MAG: biotin--[acetyl-CoA-carboxylase] ligase [Flavobacteriaceae bacterium]|nr:biotin--[acetyl-CoA-carboxylase] ligase [Flavobacteriaceae bacterium]